MNVWDINIEMLSAKHMSMGFLDVLEELTDVDLTPTEAIRAHSNIMNSMNGTVFVALEENKVIGTAAIHILPKFVHRCGFVGLIEDIVVLKSCRGRGVGQALMLRVTAYAATNHCYKIILDCNLKNIPFYEKFGFYNHEYQMRMDLV